MFWCLCSKFEGIIVYGFQKNSQSIKCICQKLWLAAGCMTIHSLFFLIEKFPKYSNQIMIQRSLKLPPTMSHIAYQTPAANRLHIWTFVLWNIWRLDKNISSACNISQNHISIFIHPNLESKTAIQCFYIWLKSL